MRNQKGTKHICIKLSFVSYQYYRFLNCRSALSQSKKWSVPHDRKVCWGNCLLSLDICFPATIIPDIAIPCVLFVWNVEGTRCSKLMSLCTTYLDYFIVLTWNYKNNETTWIMYKYLHTDRDIVSTFKEKWKQ